MSRTAVIGDVHGREGWKEIVKQEEWDRIVFNGDYFDTHEGISPEHQIENFKEIVAFNASDPGRSTLLIGNHDFHYLPEAGQDRYSGFQSEYAQAIRKALLPVVPILQVATEEQGYLISHAGVTEPWLKRHTINPNEGDLADAINLAYDQFPEKFRFFILDRSGYGDHECQGPLWVRPKALEHAFAVPKQVVGHTTQRGVVQMGGIVLNDALGSGEFTIIKDGEIEVGRF